MAAVGLAAAIAGCGGGSHARSVAAHTGASGPTAGAQTTDPASATGPSGPTGPAGPRRAHRRRRHPRRHSAASLIQAANAATGANPATGYPSPVEVPTRTPMPPPQPSSPAPSTPPPPAVEMRGIAFRPATLTVHVGETIVWLNLDSVAHDVKATAGEHFGSGSLSTGASFRFTPTTAGTISYVCTIHPQMTAKVIVTG